MPRPRSRSRSRSPSYREHRRYHDSPDRSRHESRRGRDSSGQQSGTDHRSRRRERGERDSPRHRDSPRPRDSPRDNPGAIVKRVRSRSRSRSRSPSVDKAKPNFAPSGLLAKATNTVKHADGKSTVLKYNEPPEARKPLQNWRLYIFKGKEEDEVLQVSRQSAYLIGRDRLVADIALEHPSCSKQHAAIQYRSISTRDEFGSAKNVIKPFVIDLESTNGTHVNGETIPVSRYFELKTGDVLRFGLSDREYVFLLEE